MYRKLQEIYVKAGYEVISIRKGNNGEGVVIYHTLIRDKDNQIYDSMCCGKMVEGQAVIEWMRTWLLHAVAEIDVPWRDIEDE